MREKRSKRILPTRFGRDARGRGAASRTTDDVGKASGRSLPLRLVNFVNIETNREPRTSLRCFPRGQRRAREREGVRAQRRFKISRRALESRSGTWKNFFLARSSSDARRKDVANAYSNETFASPNDDETRIDRRLISSFPFYLETTRRGKRSGAERKGEKKRENIVARLKT